VLVYYMRLACKSFARAPGITALMTVAIALGIGVCVATITVYHAMSGNPIWWKNDRLYAVTLDSWKRDQPYNPQKPKLAPPQLGYRDATALFASRIPLRKVMMYSQSLVVSGGDAHVPPTQEAVRVTTPDFFAMFDVPFLYGGPWSLQADEAAQPLVVLSRPENDKLFGGQNSVGRRVRIAEREFQVAGVINTWHPRPRFYDVNWGNFADPEDLFIPFGWTTVLNQFPSGGVSACWDDQEAVGFNFKALLTGECVWLQMWVELPDAARRERMQVFMDQYWAGQRAGGRFPRPRNNQLTNVGEWLALQGVVSNDSRILVALACAFLGVCLINSAGLLLARFLGTAGVIGVRRALGASRRQIFAQHLVEVGLIACAGALLGLAVAAVTLSILHARVARLGVGGYAELWRLDSVSLYWTLALALLSTLAAGLYPAWRIGQLPPGRFLRGQ
jgi:putative ABC transport system permease protein